MPIIQFIVMMSKEHQNSKVKKLWFQSFENATRRSKDEKVHMNLPLMI